MPIMTTGASSERDQLPTDDQPPTGDQPEATGFPYALMLTDAGRPDDPVVYVNAAFTTLTGYEADESLGRSCHFLPGADRAGAVAAALRDGGALEASIVSIGTGGDRSVGHARLVPIEPTGGKADGHAGAPRSAPASGRDAPRNEAGDELQELRHRVKNHLSLVIAMLRLRAAEGQEGEGRDALTAAASRIEAIASLYEQELEGSGAAGADARIDLGAYLRRVAATLSDLSPAVAVRLEAASGLEVPSSDAAPLGLVLSELITNALRHAYRSGEGGEIRVALDGDGAQLRLTVTDGGCGMARTGLPDGLGGTIVQALAQQLRGTLRYAEGPDGLGTRVTVTLPRPPAGG